MTDRRVRPSGRAKRPRPRRRLHAQWLAAALEQGRIAVAQRIQLADQIAADLARGIHALRQVGELGILLLEKIDQIAERHFLRRARAQDFQGDRERARLLLVGGRVLDVEHVAHGGGREVGQQLLLVLGQLVHAIGQQRNGDRPAGRAPGRIDGDVDLVGKLLAVSAPLGKVVVVRPPDVRVGVGAQVALAIDQDRGRAPEQQLLDQRKGQRRLARARATEHRRMALQDALVQRDRLRATGQLAAGHDARGVGGILVEDVGELELLLDRLLENPRGGRRDRA